MIQQDDPEKQEWARENLRNYPTPATSLPQMSLRDYFAAQVLPAIYAACDTRVLAGDKLSPEFVARAAYAVADGMLAERSK
jgi:hypothetical protein